MFIVLIFALAFADQKIVLNSPDLLKVPAGIKTEFKIASQPPTIEVMLFSGLPQPDKDTLWTSWGDGVLASNGKYYTAIGDHRGYDAASYVYEYDPGTSSVNKIIDIAEAIGQKKGDYGHGKIHAAMQEYQGSLYFATYRGKSKEVADAIKKGYKGSLLFQYDLKTRSLQNLGPIALGEGLPTTCLDKNRGLLYFYAVPSGNLVVYDLAKKQVRFKGGSEFTALHRAFMLAKDGKIYFSDAKGKLHFYNPDKNSIGETSLTLAGKKNILRAATRSAANGLIWGMTESGTLFEFNSSKQVIKDLGPNFLSGDYTASMVLSPDDKYLYFVPGAHGSAIKVGTPVVQYQIATGTRKVLGFLHDPLIQKAAYVIGGNYNMQVDSKGGTLYCTFNGEKYDSAKKRQKGFGLPAVVVIKIPASERNNR